MEYSEEALQKVVEDRLIIDQVDLWLYEEIKPYAGRRVLEAGCGMGNFARYLIDRELYVGVDISAKNVAYVEEKYGQLANVQATVCDVTSDDFLTLASRDLDTVFSLNVFEHIEDDERAIRNVAQILQPGGNFILGVPAHRRLYGSMDRSIGHYRRYDAELLRARMADAGLAVVKQKYVNALGALGWLVNGRIRRQTTPPTGQLEVMNKVVPWLRRFEAAVPAPFGITILTVARKMG